MKCLKIAISMIVMLLTVFTSYPQGMLITCKGNKCYSQVGIVDKVYRSRNDYLDIDVIVPQIKGLKNSDKEIEINDSISKWTEEWINDVRSIANEYFSDGVVPLNPYQLFTRYKVMNVEKILSFYIDYYQYTGGAHGITTRKAYNIDSETAIVLKLKDIFEENYNYKDVINNKIKEEIDKNPEMYFTGKEGFNGVDDKTKFYINDGELIIYYGNYEIAPYVAGMPEFHIPINMFEGGFKYDKI